MIFLLLIFSLSRVVFFIFNLDEFSGIAFSKIAFSFIHGIRFDIAAILMFNVPFVLASLMPFQFFFHKYYQNTLKAIFVIVNATVLYFNHIDIEYHKFTGKRATYDLLSGIADDAASQSLQLLKNYWHISFIMAIFLFLLIRYYPILHFTYVTPRHKWAKWAAGYMVLIGLSVLGIRGGFQLKPIGMNMAYTGDSMSLGILTLNTPFTLVKTFEMRKTALQRTAFFDEKTIQNLITPSPYSGLDTTYPRQNIVIIILESFAAEYTGFMNDSARYTPFLDSLAKKSVVFKNNFANGRTSMDALPAVLAGIPHLMEEQFITSVYQTNRIDGLGTVLMKEGYHTSFFHGAKNGSMRFDDFCKNAGFSNYFGKNEFIADNPTKESDIDGAWGVFDEPFLQYMLSKLNTFKTPFISGIFTISSHQPYNIPAQHQGKFPKGTLEIHESIGYTDFSLRQFFGEAQKQAWFKNTFFIITADHTQHSDDKKYANFTGTYQVPLLIYHPVINLPKDTQTKTTQQIDIPATVFDLLGIKKAKILPFSESLFKKSEGKALTFLNEGYYLFTRNHYWQLRNGVVQVYDRNDVLVQNDSLLNTQKNNLKAYVQFYNNSMIDNSWYK